MSGVNFYPSAGGRPNCAAYRRGSIWAKKSCSAHCGDWMANGADCAKKNHFYIYLRNDDFYSAELEVNSSLDFAWGGKGFPEVQSPWWEMNKLCWYFKMQFASHQKCLVIAYWFLFDVSGRKKWCWLKWQKKIPKPKRGTGETGWKPIATETVLHWLQEGWGWNSIRKVVICQFRRWNRHNLTLKKTCHHRLLNLGCSNTRIASYPQSQKFRLLFHWNPLKIHKQQSPFKCIHLNRNACHSQNNRYSQTSRWRCCDHVWHQARKDGTAPGDRHWE